MAKVKEIIEIIENAAPKSLAEEWDNVGLMSGSPECETEKVLCALEADLGVVEEAVRKGCKMILTHHPLIFRPVSFVTDETETGKILLKLAENGISLYSAHTNFDCANGGINDFLCEKIGLKNVEVLKDVSEGNLIRRGETEPVTLKEFAVKLAKLFGKKYIRVVGDPDKVIKYVGICSGGGGEFIGNMTDKCDLFITGDVKYHSARDAAYAGLSVCILEHFESECCVKEIFAKLLRGNGIAAEISESNADVVYDVYI